MALKKTGYFTIYKATSPSGKVYIGYTHFSLKDRMNQHYREAKLGKTRPFYNCLLKYGNKVKWEVINIYYTEKYAKNREQYFISKYDCVNPKKGYNCTIGGEGTPNLVRTSQKIKVIDNLGNIYIGYQEIEQKLGFSRQEVYGSIKYGYWCKDYYFSKYKNYMLKANPRKSKNKECRKKRITCLKNGISFLSIKDASDYLGKSHQAIYRVCAGKRNHVNGYYFRYVDVKENNGNFNSR